MIDSAICGLLNALSQTNPDIASLIRATSRRQSLCEPSRGARRPTGDLTFLFDQFVCADQDRRRDRQSERLRGCQVDTEFEFGGLLNRKIRRRSSLEDLVDIAGGLP